MVFGLLWFISLFCTAHYNIIFAFMCMYGIISDDDNNRWWWPLSANPHRCRCRCRIIVHVSCNRNVKPFRRISQLHTTYILIAYFLLSFVVLPLLGCYITLLLPTYILICSTSSFYLFIPLLHRCFCAMYYLMCSNNNNSNHHNFHFRLYL